MKLDAPCRFPKERRKLLAMVKRDQAVRLRKESYQQMSETMLEMSRIDIANYKQLKKILEVIKYPSVANVGADGAQAVWLIAQHATFDLQFMLHVLKLMQRIAKKDPAQTYYRGIPYLIDRTNDLQGKKQIYGTQFWRNSSGEMLPFPMEDIEHVDERRKVFGLEPYEENKRVVAGQQP